VKDENPPVIDDDADGAPPGTVRRLLVLDLVVPVDGMKDWICEKSGTCARWARHSSGLPIA